MKNHIVAILTLLSIISCQQQNKSPITIQKIIQKYDSLTEVSYKVKQIWKGPIPGSLDSSSGNCSFVREASDTLIGAHYLFIYDNGITQLYNGKIYVRAIEESKSAEIYKLEEYPDPLRRITSSVFYLLSVNEIINDLRESYEKKPNNIIVLKDTIINKFSRFRIKLVEKDTLINGSHVEIYSELVFDKTSCLPLFAIKTRSTPGEIYMKHITEVYFSEFKLSTDKTNEVFDLSSIPFGIDRITYASDNQNLPSLKIKSIAPGWNATLTNGDSISSEDQTGKIILLNFTSVYCGYCIKANKVLSNIDKKYANSNLNVISIYPIDKIGNINYFVNKSDIRHPIVYNASKMQKDFMVEGFPNLFLINQKGKIEYVALGYTDKLESDLKKSIDKLLENK